MAIITVGPGQQYATIAAGIAAAQDGDTVQVQAGTYVNDYAMITKSITLEGVGGMVKMVSTGLIPNTKGILIVNSIYSNADVTISNFEFSGATVADHNGAGIRQQGGDLTLNHCYFHNNEEGVLTGNRGMLTINNCEFAKNGYGDAQTHNLYAGFMNSLTINNSYFHDVNGQGSEVKSRALNTTITNSRIYDLNATSSYSIDVPNGGRTVIQNNVIEQGPFSANTAIIAFGYGVQGLNPSTSLLVSGNTILNDEAIGSARAVINYTTAMAQITGNSFYGLTSSQIASGPNTQSGDEFLTTEPSLDTSHPATFPITQIPISIRLASDTGTSATDKLTKDPAVRGTGGARTLVTIKEGTKTLGTTTADSTGAWSFMPTGLADGVHVLTAIQSDLAGNTNTAALIFTLDETAPPVTIALSSDTGLSSTDRVTKNPAVKGRGDANTLVTIKEGATTLGTTTSISTGAWSFTPTGLADGVHTMTATETDLAGNSKTAMLSFTLDRTAPVVTIGLSADTGRSTTDKLTKDPSIKGTGQANTLVTIKEGTSALGTTTASSTGIWSFTPTGLVDGVHRLTTTQTDIAGNTGTATLGFTLDRTPPAVTIALVSDTGSSSVDRITSDPAVHGSGNANTAVTVKEGSTVLGTTMADITGAWSFTPTGLVDGTHTLTATETDLAGNTGKATLSFTLDMHNMTGVA